MIVSIGANATVSVINDSAQQITLKVTESYTLGDNDTMTSAKGLTLEQAKKSAADYAGTYVESELKVTDAQITKQQVRVLTAGFMEVLNRSDKRAVDNNGNVILNTTANIRLSKESIKDGLAKLKSDPERKAKIQSLEETNQRLRNELVELTKKINAGNSRTDLMKARETILADLDNNRQAAAQVFKEGTLFQLAELDNQDFELALQDIDENVFGYLKHETKVTVGKPKFTKNNDGTYNIVVSVAWNAPKTPAEKVLSKYIKMANPRYVKNAHMGKQIPYSCSFATYDNKGDKQQDQYTEKLVSYIRGKEVVIDISAGNHHGSLPIATTTGGMSNLYYAFQFSNDSKNNVTVREEFQNPVTITGISKAELQKITTLKANVIIRNAEKRRW